MPIEVIGMYGAITGGTQDALASVDVPQDGVITGIDWDLRADLDGDSEAVNAEVSFIATNQLAQNDVRGRISSISAMISLTTSGAPMTSIQKYVGLADLVVAGGERLYLHADSVSGVTGAVRANLHFQPDRTTSRRSARRR